jgi:hypothetical protein
MDNKKIYSFLSNHVRNFFLGHRIAERIWTLGPILQTLPHFRVLEIAPGEKSNLWTYISLGAWEASETSKIEFMLLAPEENITHVERLAMTAYYHRNHGLGLGHTFPLGEAWLDDSLCDYMLVSLPYPFGQELEICNFNGTHVHFFWLLPITKAERDFKVEYGLEALENKFEEKELEYWRIDRESVV